jgi:hypothetical protein
MTKPIARLTGSLLARKGEATPAASVIDFNVTGMFNRPAEVDSGTPATHPTAAPTTERPAAGTYSDGSTVWEETTPFPAQVDPEELPDPDVLMRQLVNHSDFQPLDSTGTPTEEQAAEIHHLSEDVRNDHASDHHSPAKRRALTVRLDPDRYQRFKVLAQVGGRTNQEILMDALNEYLDHTATDFGPDHVKASYSEPKQAGDGQLAAIAIELGFIRKEVEKIAAAMSGAKVQAEEPYPAI